MKLIGKDLINSNFNITSQNPRIFTNDSTPALATIKLLPSDFVSNEDGGNTKFGIGYVDTAGSSTAGGNLVGGQSGSGAGSSGKS